MYPDGVAGNVQHATSRYGELNFHAGRARLTPERLRHMSGRIAAHVSSSVLMSSIFGRSPDDEADFKKRIYQAPFSGMALRDGPQAVG